MVEVDVVVAVILGNGAFVTVGTMDVGGNVFIYLFVALFIMSSVSCHIVDGLKLFIYFVSFLFLIFLVLAFFIKTQPSSCKI